LLQLAAYNYPNSKGIVTPFQWDWHATKLSDTFAGLKIVDGVQVVIMPGTGGDVGKWETLRQWILDFTALPLRTRHSIGWVVSGFYKQMPAFVKELIPQLDKTLPIIVIGHSRGAAQACDVAMLLIVSGFTVDRVVGFACPRPGGPGFAKFLNHYTEVVLYCTKGNEWPYYDLVPYVPFNIPYFEKAVSVVQYKFLQVTPLPLSTWFLFRYHDMHLYAGALNPYAKIDP
jgi:pimeloyl-ACP methyl ester carboxylesterase